MRSPFPAGLRDGRLGLIPALACLLLLLVLVGTASAQSAARRTHSVRGRAGHAPATKYKLAHVAGGPQTHGWDGFGAGQWPGARWRPYSDASPFNQRIGDASVVDRSSAIVADVLSRWGNPAPLVAGSAGTSDDYSHPVYYSQPTDPTLTLHATADWGPNALNGKQIPVPARAQPAAGGDGHMTIVTPDGWEYDLWEAHRSGHSLRFAWGGRTRIDGDGLGSGATAASFGNLAGIIRPEELAAGSINHALFITLKCTAAGTSFGHGTQASPSDTPDGSYVYPAAHGGTRCSGQDPNLPPLGTRFMLDMSAKQIQGLDVPAWKKTILTALAKYGGYVGDTGGPGFGFEFESSASYTSFGAADPLVALARQYGLSSWHGEYSFNIGSGVNWKRFLRVVAPPTRDR